MSLCDVGGLHGDAVSHLVREVEPATPFQMFFRHQEPGAVHRTTLLRATHAAAVLQLFLHRVEDLNAVEAICARVPTTARRR